MTNSQGIEGLPPGTRISEIRPPRCQDRALVARGVYKVWDFIALTDYPILAPDNVYGRFLDEVPEPPGRKFATVDGERVWRVPTEDDDWLSTDGTILHGCIAYGVDGAANRRLILEPLPKKRRVLVIECECTQIPDKKAAMVGVSINGWQAPVDTFRIEERDA